MKQNERKPAFIIAVLFEIIFIYASAVSIAQKQWSILGLSLVSMICLTLPFIIAYIADKKNLALPPGFQLIALIFLFLTQYLGEIKNFYKIFWWWDLFLHAVFGSYAVIIALTLIEGIFIRGLKTTNRRFHLFAALFAFCFSIALGTLWELFEFASDFLFKTHLVKGGLDDTMTDLLAKMLAAFLTSVFCYLRRLKTRH